MKFYINSLFIAASLITFTACKKDKNDVTKPQVVNEEELITTLKVKLITGTDTTVFQFRDPDGEGGVNGTVDTIKLKTTGTYKCELQFLDESNPLNVEDITHEIEEEAVDHLICFSSSLVNFQITDKDANQLPLGIESNWTVNTNGTGSLTVRLRHQPGIKDGDCDKGETDLQVVFPIVIQ